MIWEVGQDCRSNSPPSPPPFPSPAYLSRRASTMHSLHRRVPVHRDGQTHVATCSDQSDSLLLAITDVLTSRGIKRAALPSPPHAAEEL